MSEFVKKTAFGYKKVDGGHSDPECTHVILTIDEYDEILREKAKAEQETRNTKRDAEREISRVKQDARYEVENAAEEARQTVESMKDDLAEERAESDYQRRLNANLLRISKERANADRKLKPKKGHTGYVVVSSAEKYYSYREDRQRWRKVMLWETVLQTPYSVDFTHEQVEIQSAELCREDETGNWPVAKIGIDENYGRSYEQLMDDPEWGAWKKYNVMLRRQLKANYRTGYWEIIFMHTKPLTVVPADMRVC